MNCAAVTITNGPGEVMSASTSPSPASSLTLTPTSTYTTTVANGNACACTCENQPSIAARALLQHKRAGGVHVKLHERDDDDRQNTGGATVPYSQRPAMLIADTGNGEYRRVDRSRLLLPSLSSFLPARHTS